MPPTTTSKNLGQISAVKIGETEPSNKNMLWIDTSFNPSKKKAWDILTSSWIEVVFLPSPANITKRIIYRFFQVGDDAIYLQDEDVFYKEIDGIANVNLPLPNANFDGKTFKLVNTSGVGDIQLNIAVKGWHLDEDEIGGRAGGVPPNNIWEILCCKNPSDDDFSWRLISHSYKPVL